MGNNNGLQYDLLGCIDKQQSCFPGDIDRGEVPGEFPGRLAVTNGVEITISYPDMQIKYA
jgi:hypothetical protein